MHQIKTGGAHQGMSLTPPDKIFLKFFTWYSRRYILSKFRSLRILKSALPKLLPNRPSIVFFNHPSWWDPLTCLVLREHFFPQHSAYALIESKQLERYSFFKRLGFIGVEKDSPSSARNLLRASSTLFNHPLNMLWLTPQGEFSDVRSQPHFKEGISLIWSKFPSVQLLPMALEYIFWNEPQPEILCAFGDPMTMDTLEVSESGKDDLNRVLEKLLTETMKSLSTASQTRNADCFETILSGSKGIHWVYDGIRAFKARLSGHQPAITHEASV